MEISHIAARRFCADVFGSYGFTRRESESIADALLRADLYGIESHGIQRLARYHEEIAGGAVDVRARPETVFETKISAVVDGAMAMGRALEMAGEHGVGMVAVRNSNHYGIAGYYTRMASERDFMGICMTNTEAICVPTFGKQAMLGTNPIAVSLPAEPFDFTFDSATTVVPRGKLEVYKKNEAPLPDGWALDSEGRPSGDAAEVLGNIIGKLGGGIAPLGGLGETLGGHKGYGLAAIVDIFTGIFSGGATSDAVNTLPGRTDICHYFAAVDYGLFGDKKAIKDRLSQFLAGLRASRKAAGQGRIYTHGEKEAELMAARANAAFPVNGKTWEEMRAIAETQGLDFAAYFKEGRAWQA